MTSEPLSRSAAEPLYLQLAARLSARITAGEFGVQGRLPAEPELMRTYAVSRITVRQAIARLAHGGRVVARAGKGTFVLPPLRQHDLGALRGFYDALRAQGLEPQMELLSFDAEAGRLDATLPAGLDLPVRLRRRYRLDDQPFAVVEAWLPPAAAVLGPVRAARLTVYQIVEDFLQERVAAADVAIRCQPCGPGIARELSLARRSPVLQMERRSMSESGRVLEFMRIHIVPERYEFRLRVPGPLEIARSVTRAPAEPQTTESERTRRPR